MDVQRAADRGNSVGDTSQPCSVTLVSAAIPVIGDLQPDRPMMRDGANGRLVGAGMLPDVRERLRDGEGGGRGNRGRRLVGQVDVETYRYR